MPGREHPRVATGRRQPRHHRTLGWWIAVLFMVGSSLFALGAFPPYADHADPRAVALTFFVGSIFFTLAAYLQYVQVVNAGTDGSARSRPRLLAWQPRRTDWWAASVQSVGTLLFNISTLSAVDAAFTVQQQDRLVWAPDLFGSVAFMIASSLAWVSVCHGWWAPRPHDRSWWVAALNLAGSDRLPDLRAGRVRPTGDRGGARPPGGQPGHLPGGRGLLRRRGAAAPPAVRRRLRRSGRPPTAVPVRRWPAGRRVVRAPARG